MTLKHALKICGYSVSDLQTKLRKKGYNLTDGELRKICQAYRPGGKPVWNAVLSSLDEMGVDW